MCIYFSDLTDNQQATVRAIFTVPPRSDVPWKSVLDLFNGLNGSVSLNARMVCVAINCEGEPIVGVFTCLDEKGYVSSHMIKALQDLLSGVGVEPQ